MAEIKDSILFRVRITNLKADLTAIRGDKESNMIEKTILSGFTYSGEFEECENSGTLEEKLKWISEFSKTHHTVKIKF